jgi:3-oxoadipate enol-lactonase
MGDESGFRQRPVAVPQGRFVELGGRGRTFVHELAGPVGAPAVLLLHGWSATAALNWSGSFVPLSARFRVIAIDHRGHGHGLRAATPFRLEDCADDAAALLAELGIDRCIAVGYSMGGAIAQLLCQRHPQLVGGMVLCATGATFHGTNRERLLAAVAAGGSLFVGLPPMRRAVMTATGMLRGCRRLAWRGHIATEGHDWTRIAEAGREICRFDSRAWLPGLSVPTAVLATNADDIVPHQRQLELAHTIRDATLRIIPGGHTVCTTAPERFVPALVAACTEVAAGFRGITAQAGRRPLPCAGAQAVA